jgi:hypothetical protein
MPQSRTRSQRAAQRSRYRKPKRKRSGSLGWNVAIAAVLVVGVVALTLAVLDHRDSGAGGGPPRAPSQADNVAGDHWHTAFQVNICGEWLTAEPQFEKPADNPGQQANVGIHTHGDDLIHTHPFVVSEEGNNATLGKFAEYAGWSVSSDSIDAWVGPESKPGQTEWSNGDTCTFGEFKGQKGQLTWKVDDKARTGDPSDYKMKDGETLAVYFLPKGADRPFPPDACTAFSQINDNATANLSKSSPCLAIDATTTTLPGETTTVPAPTSTSSP